MKIKIKFLVVIVLFLTSCMDFTHFDYEKVVGNYEGQYHRLVLDDDLSYKFSINDTVVSLGDYEFKADCSSYTKLRCFQKQGSFSDTLDIYIYGESVKFDNVVFSIEK